MGNSDLIIIVNGMAYLILGRNYRDRNEAVRSVINHWEAERVHTKKICDFPEQIDTEIKTIQVIEIVDEIKETK